MVIDLDGFNPRDHEFPIAALLQAHDAATASGSVAMLARVRNTRPPAAEVRSLVQAKVRDIGEAMAVISIAVEEAGFRGAAFRSVVSGARLVGLITAPVEISTSLDEAKGRLEAKLKRSQDSLAEAYAMF